MYEIKWKNIIQPDRPQMTIWHMCLSCWIPKATNIHSGYVVLIAFPLQQWLHECASLLHYIYKLPVLFQYVLCSISQALWCHLWRKFSVVMIKVMCTASLTSASLENLFSTQGFQTCDNQVELCVDCKGVWEKFRSQLPDWFSSSCHSMWIRIIMDQKNHLWQQTSVCLFQIAGFSFNFSIMVYDAAVVLYSK